jgi:hypothetical protein
MKITNNYEASIEIQIPKEIRVLVFSSYSPSDDSCSAATNLIIKCNSNSSAKEAQYILEKFIKNIEKYL